MAVTAPSAIRSASTAPSASSAVSTASSATFTLATASVVSALDPTTLSAILAPITASSASASESISPSAIVSGLPEEPSPETGSEVDTVPVPAPLAALNLVDAKPGIRIDRDGAVAGLLVALEGIAAIDLQHGGCRSQIGRSDGRRDNGTIPTESFNVRPSLPDLEVRLLPSAEVIELQVASNDDALDPDGNREIVGISGSPPSALVILLHLPINACKRAGCTQIRRSGLPKPLKMRRRPWH